MRTDTLVKVVFRNNEGEIVGVLDDWDHAGITLKQPTYNVDQRERRFFIPFTSILYIQEIEQ